MLTCKIIRCTCQHSFQDTKYGSSMRVHNLAKQLGSSPKWRCTVCGNEKESTSSAKK